MMIILHFCTELVIIFFLVYINVVLSMFTGSSDVMKAMTDVVEGQLSR